MLINTHPSLPNLASSKSAAMADEFNSSINWWDPSRTRFDNTAAAAAASTAVVSSTAVDSSSAAADDHLHMMGLGLSSQAAAMDWNHALLRGEKGGDQHDHQQSSFRSMLQEDQQSLNYGGMGMWRDRSSTSSSYSSETTSLRGFSLEQPPLHDFCGGGGNGGGMFQAAGVLLGSDHHFDGRLTGSYAAAAAYGGGNTTTSSSNNTAEFGIDLSSSSNWSGSSNNKVAQFLRSNNVSPPKPPQTTQLHFSNNAPFWNASAGMGGSDVRPPPATGGFFPTLHHHQQQQQQQQQQQHFPASSSFDEKPKNNSIAGEEGNSRAAVVKKSEGGGGGTAGKRSRNETTASTLPAFKVRKEKMGDRITALQQLVSPFGKTDTASVLSEAIEYIKFLHDQISVLSTPYMKSGAPIHLQQQSCDKKSKEKGEAQKDLRSRGLCLVPVSSTFPVTHETTVDFWTPTFGGTFR